MRYVVRPLQRTWYGRTRSEVLAEADRLESLARRERVDEISYRIEEEAAFLRHNAQAMADDQGGEA